jgi:hypothetical protein
MTMSGVFGEPVELAESCTIGMWIALALLAFHCKVPQYLLLTLSYRQQMSDDAILFSVDFPRTKPKDFFGIRNDGDSFALETLRRRCCSDGKSSVALAVSSHGQCDVAAILKTDGTCP